MKDSAHKILAISLEDSRKFKAYAVFDGERLVITSVIPIAYAFKNALIEEIITRKEAGFIVIVSEKTDFISQYGICYRLEEVTAESSSGTRTNLYEALDWYFALSASGNLIFHEDVKKYEIRDNSEKIQKGQDDKGRITYRVNWQEFTGAHRAILLCVVAAMIQPVSEIYLREFYGSDFDNSDVFEDNPMDRFRKILEGREK